uniref:Uncharacterized protein n=1 Tax=Candidatus Kentrum sp. FW TaxID=2126338 RepID=A0A450TPK5_9GAMM|nr:MAG: hypothetical protein BECKFW1821C_GA0114237_102030 [Candidatus Kentron sp. FW]
MPMATFPNLEKPDKIKWLYIVRDILGSYGGGIEFHSIPEQGAEFIIRLPIYKEEIQKEQDEHQ